jgi:hypothetical protein
VALDADARISFNPLQHHRSKAQALLFYVFDVLIHRGRSLLLTSPSADKPKLASSGHHSMGSYCIYLEPFVWSNL